MLAVAAVPVVSVVVVEVAAVVGRVLLRFSSGRERVRILSQHVEKRYAKRFEEKEAS